MKRLVLMAAAMMMGLAASAQVQGEVYPSYLSVNGKAEREVVPNEIYVNIVIDEADTKGRISVAEQERSMIAELRKLGIDVDKDLQVGGMSGGLKSYVLRRDQVQTSKGYTLKLHDVQQLDRVFSSLAALNISQLAVTKVTRDDMDAIRMELRVEAMRNAREVATTLAGAVDQKVGKAFRISDNGYYGNGDVLFMEVPMMSRANYDAAAAETGTGASLEFKNIKMEYSISVQFVLE